MRRKNKILEAEKRKSQGVPPTPKSSLTGTQHVGQVAMMEEVKRLEPDVLQALENLHGKTLDEKKQIKQALVEKYKDHCHRFAASRYNFQNDVFSNWIVWLFDIEEIGEFLKFSNIAINKQQQTPFYIKKNWFDCRSWLFVDWAAPRIEAGETVEPYWGQMLQHWQTFSKSCQQEYLKAEFKRLLNEDEEAAYIWGKMAMTHNVKIKTAFNNLKNRLGR